jgi:GrpB-like predicted nucleotidyltransferase (UPF0157 family)
VPGRPDATVEVVAYSAQWPVLFDQERAALAASLGAVAVSVEHIGSTAVPGLAAKPTIDILVVVDDMTGFTARIPALETLGYEHRPHNTLVGSPTHAFLRKVVDGKRTNHLHVVLAGSPQIERYRRFRDALRSDPELAERYAALKRDLARRHADDRMRYVEEKSAWVDAVVEAL